MWIFLLSLLLNAEAKRVLWARVSDRDGHKIPANCFFSGHQPVLHQAGLLLRVNCYGESDLYTQLLWIQKSAPTQEILRSKWGSLLSEPVSDGTSIFISEYNEAGTRQLYRIAAGQVQNFSLPKGVQQLQGLSISQNILLARFQNQQGHSKQAFFKDGQWQELFERDVSFYFQPQASSKLVVQKIRRGAGDLSENQPDEIQLSTDGGATFQTVIKDRDSDVNSEYLSFWNFSVVNGEWWLVIARTLEGDVAIVGRGEQISHRHKLSGLFEKLDFWPGAIDLQGRVYLRAQRLGVHGLWRVGSSPELILRSGDTFQGDQDLQRVRQDTPFYNAPMIDQNRLFIGVGVEDFNSSTFLGQALIEVLIP